MATKLLEALQLHHQRPDLAALGFMLHRDTLSLPQQSFLLPPHRRRGRVPPLLVVLLLRPLVLRQHAAQHAGEDVSDGAAIAAAVVACCIWRCLGHADAAAAATWCIGGKCDT